MSDQNESTALVSIIDPRWRDAVATVENPVIVIEPGGLFRACDTEALGLGEDHGRWLAFIDEAVGGSAESSVKYRGPLHSYYMNSEAYHRGTVADFNPVATLLSAHDLGVQLRQAQPMFGTVVLTGFVLRTYLPCPLDQGQTVAFLDAVQANEEFAHAVAEHLQETGEAAPGQ
jgi:hypothetical protein